MSTGQLNIQIMKWMAGSGLTAGAVGQLRSLFRSATGSKPIQETIIIPTNGSNDAPLSMQLEAGDWYVEVELPWGEFVAEEFHVPADGEVAVDLEVAHSPHENLGWLHLQGAVPSYGQLHPAKRVVQGTEVSRRTLEAGLQTDVLKTRVTMGAGRSAGASATVDSGDFMVQQLPMEVIEEELRKSAQAAPDRLVRVAALGDRDGILNWRSLGQSSGALSDAPFPNLTQLYESEVPADDLFVTHVFTPPDPAPIADEKFERQWLHVEGFGERSLLSMPNHWFHQGMASEYTVVARFIEADRGLAQILLQDEDMAALLGYMTVDRLHLAAELAKHAADMLFGKVSRPLAACCGGYVMLATQLSSDSDEEYWHNWIVNLNNWFKWLPDGAILEGTMRLNGPKFLRDFDRAAECFAIAFERGIPFISLGLPWLLSGLRMLESSYPSLDGASTEVERIARRLDTHRPFTTLRLGASES